MHPKHWLDKKPQTIKDWLGLAFLCLAFFTLAGQAGGCWPLWARWRG